MPVGLLSVIPPVVLLYKKAGFLKMIALLAVVAVLGACFAISSDAIVERINSNIAARIGFLPIENLFSSYAQDDRTSQV